MVPRRNKLLVDSNESQRYSYDVLTVLGIESDTAKF